MKSVWIASFSIILLAGAVLAQAPKAAQTVVSGSITAVNAASNVVTVKTTTGETLDLTITPRSFIMHLPLGETDRSKAAKLAIGDLTAGEELVASLAAATDPKVKEVRTIYVRTKADIEEMAKKEDEDWRKRGTTGNLSAINAAAKTFTRQERRQRHHGEAHG